MRPLWEQRGSLAEPRYGNESLRRWNAEVLTDLRGEVVVDLGAPWDCGRSAGGTDEDGMVGAFAQQVTTVLLQVAHRRAPLHALTLRGSRITGPLPVVC